MAGRADFTADEWYTLQTAMVGGPMLVSVAERGLIQDVAEMQILYRELESARATYPSLLVRELAEFDIRNAEFRPRTAPGEIEDRALEALRSAVTILTAKAPEELAAYRDFVYHLCLRVAEAAHGVSEVEQAALAKVQTALALSN